MSNAKLPPGWDRVKSNISIMKAKLLTVRPSGSPGFFLTPTIRTVSPVMFSGNNLGGSLGFSEFGLLIVCAIWSWVSMRDFNKGLLRIVPNSLASRFQDRLQRNWRSLNKSLVSDKIGLGEIEGSLLSSTYNKEK